MKNQDIAGVGLPCIGRSHRESCHASILALLRSLKKLAGEILLRRIFKLFKNLFHL